MFIIIYCFRPSFFAMLMLFFASHLRIRNIPHLSNIAWGRIAEQHSILHFTEISTHLPSTAPQHWHTNYNPTKEVTCSKCSRRIVIFRRWRKHHINVGFIWISTENKESIVSIYISLNGYEVHSKRAIEVTYVPVAFSIRNPPWNSEYIPVACTIASLTTVIVPFNKRMSS